MLKLQYFAHLMWRADSFKKTLMLGKIEGRRRRGQQRMRWLDGIPTQWTWIWTNSRMWWRTGKPGILQSTGLQRHDWSDWTTTEKSAAAKSLQLCLTLCDPTDGSPPGSPFPGILQARTLEWVAISFSNAWKWKVKGSRSVMPDSLQPHGRQPTRLLHPWDFPGKSTGVGCHCLLRMEMLELKNSITNTKKPVNGLNCSREARGKNSMIGNTQSEQQGEMTLKKSIKQNPKDVWTLTKGLSFMFPEFWKEKIKRVGLTKHYKK